MHAPEHFIEVPAATQMLPAPGVTLVMISWLLYSNSPRRITRPLRKLDPTE